MCGGWYSDYTGCLHTELVRKIIWSFFQGVLKLRTLWHNNCVASTGAWHLTTQHMCSKDSEVYESQNVYTNSRLPLWVCTVKWCKIQLTHENCKAVCKSFFNLTNPQLCGHGESDACLYRVHHGKPMFCSVTSISKTSFPVTHPIWYFSANDLSNKVLKLRHDDDKIVCTQ